MGRPSKFRSAVEVEKRCNEYFNYCDNYKLKKINIDKEGVETIELIPKPKPYTVIGLALYLGYVNKQSIYDLRDKKNKFSVPIEAALSNIEHQYVSNGLNGTFNPMFTQFILKHNYSYSDNLQLTGPGGGPILLSAIPLEPPTLAEYQKMIREQQTSKQIEHKPKGKNKV